MKKANQEYQNNKTINNHLSKKLLASSGFLTGAIVSLSPYLAKVITPKTIYVQNFVADNVSPNSGDFSFKLQGKTKQDTDWAKKADLELVYISQKSRYSVKTKVEYDPKTDTFHTYADNLLGGSIYELQLVAPNNPRYYFSFSKTSQFFSTKNQVEKFSHYDIENDTILDLDLFDSQNLLDSANLILYYKEIGSNKIQEAKGQLVAKNDQKQASFVLRNLDRNQKYEIVGTKYYFDDPDQLFDLAISPLANRYFAPSPIAGKILNLSQKAYGLNSALLEISLAFENKNIKINPNEKINLEYYYKDELDNFQFGVANDVSLVVQNNKVFANLDLKQIPGGTKFWISRIWNNSGSLAISTNNNLSFISAPEIARIRTFVDANNTSSFDIKFNDQSLMLNGKEVKINFFADDQPTKMLSSSAHVVGNKLFSLAKNLPKEKHFTISSLEIVENATNFDENGQPQTSQIFFAQNFDQKQKKFFTNATSAMVESVVVDRISEDQSRVSMILDSVDDFIKDKIATLYFKVAGSSNLIKSQAQAFSINGNKLVLSWDLINLEPGTNYLIDSVGIADSTNEFVNKLFFKFWSVILVQKTNLNYPSSCLVQLPIQQNLTLQLNLILPLKISFESLKKAKITYKELIPGGTSKTVDATIENNSIIANLPIDSLAKGQNYLIEKIEVEDYKSSKGDPDILAVSKTITPAQKIFGVHAPLVLTKIENLDEQQTTAKLKVTFSPETIKAIGNDKVKIYYSLAGSSKLLSAFAEQTNTTSQNPDNSLTFELKDLEIGSKYNINSIVLTKEVELNQDTNKVLTERNILFGDADNKFDSSQSSFFTQSAIIEVGYDNSYEQRVIATFILADAKGVYNGNTATLKYRLKAKNGDENLATTANFKEGKISAKVNSARILFDITDLYKQGLYEIDKNSLELEGTTTSPATTPVQANARVRRSLAQFADTNTTAVLIPFKDKLLDSTEKSQFETIPKTANVTKIQLTNRTKNTAQFEVEFGKDFVPNHQNAQATTTEKLDDFLNKNKLKVRFKKIRWRNKNKLLKQQLMLTVKKTTFELTGLENGQQYVILGFEQVQDGATQQSTPKVDIYLDDLDFYKDQIIATAAVIKKIEFDTEVETQARLRLQLKDDGRYTAGKKLIVELEKIDATSGLKPKVKLKPKNLVLSGTSLNGIYDFTFLNLEKATKYKIKSVKFEKKLLLLLIQVLQLFSSRRSKRSLDPVLVNVDSQSAAIQEEEIELLETDKDLEAKKSFVTTANTAKLSKLKLSQFRQFFKMLNLLLIMLMTILGQQKLQLTYRNLSNNTSTSQDVEATVDKTAKTITFQLSNLSPGDKYEIENIKLKDESTQVRNELDLKKQEFKFEFDNSPNTQAGFEKQFFSPRPSLAQIKPISTSETSVQINVKLNDNGANWNNKFLQIKIRSKGTQTTQPQIPTVYSAEIINGNAVFDISGLEKAGQYEIEELKVLDSLPTQPQPDQIQGGEKVDGFDSAAGSSQPAQQVTKEFVLDAESATITDISYKSDNTSADVRVSFAQNEQFLYQSSANTKRKLQFTFQDSQTGQQVTTEKEFESNNQGTKPTIDLSLDSVSPGNLYVLTKVEDITHEVEGGPKRLKTFKFSDPQPAQGTQNQATTTPEVLSKLYFATKPEVIAYSIDKISETKYLASFTIKDPLAGREITNGGFEGRDVEITLQKMVQPDGTDLGDQTVYNVQQKAKIKNSKFSFELDGLEKNAIYKVLSLTWADTKQTQQTISGQTATRYDVDPTTKTPPSTQQQFSDFAIKVSDPGTNSQIEGNVSGNGQIEFGQNFIIKPESAKISQIDIDDKKVDSATITLTFDKTDEYLKHVDYKDKLELVYYQTGSTAEKISPLTLDNSDPNKVKFKAKLADLEKGTGFRVLGIKQAGAAQQASRRRRSTTSAKPLNFVFDTKVTEETKKFATLPIVNSILQFRNDANPENYDFILNLKDTGDVFKHIQAGQKSIKAKIQFKKVVDGNEAKDTIQEVLATLQSTSATSGQDKKSADELIQDSTTFKFTLSGLDPFAQYYITKIAYDTNNQLDSVLTTKTEANGDQNSGLFNFSPQAEEKRAFLTYPAKVDVKSIEIQPDFSQNNAKLTIKFDPKFKAFLETHQKIKVNYTSPKGLGQSVEINKDNFNTKLITTGQESTVEVTINNINEPGKYVVESLDFIKHEDLKSSPLLSNLEVPPIAIKESVTIAKRSFYTNTKIIAIRKKAISETSATIELVIEDPNGSFIGKAVKGTFTYNTDRTMEENGTIIADEIEKTSKVVFQLKDLDKNTDYSITSLVFDQAQNQDPATLGGAQTQFQAQQNIEFDDQKIQENAQQDSTGQPTPDQEKQFKTTFESATALGITYQLDKGQNGKPWQKAKVRVFFASQDKPLEEKSTRLKLVYKSSKQGISNTTKTSVQSRLVQTQAQSSQSWLNNQPDRAHYYYEFDLDNLDAGAQYTIIGLEDEAQQIKIIVPDPNAPVTVTFSSQPSVQSSFSFNTAPLITKMTYVPSETSIKLNLAVENSQKLDFTNHRAIIKFKKLRRKNNTYGWWDPTTASATDPSSTENIDSVTVRVPQRQPSAAVQAQQESEENFGITFLEFELGGLQKGNWYLIEEISLVAKGQNPTPLSLYIDKEKLQPLDKRVETSEAEKWQTIVNTIVETTAITSVTSSTTRNSRITVSGRQKNQAELTNGYFQIELDSGDWTFLKDKYNIQLELESVERKVFYTESKLIADSSAPRTGGQRRQVVLEAKGLIPGDKYTIKNYIFNLKEGVQNSYAVRLPQKLKVTPPANNSTIDLKTKNAIKAIKYEAVSEGQTNVDVEFYNNNGELNNQNLELKAKIDKQFGNKYIPRTWDQSQKTVTKSTRLTATGGQITSTLQFQINSGLKKAKQYIIESIKKGGQPIAFDTPISNESALQRKFYSTAENTKLIKTEIKDVTTDSATITLEFDQNDAFLKDDLVTLYLEKGDKSQSIGTTTTITTGTGGGAQDKLQATFKFLNILEPGRKYKINALTSKTVNLKVDDTQKAQNPNLTQGWSFAGSSGSSTSSASSSSSSSTGSGNQVILDFITQPLITNIVKTQINDNDATIELEGWTKDLQDAGFNPKFTVTEKNPTPTQPPQQQQQSSGPKEGRKENSNPPVDNKITFKVDGLEQFTEYNDITLTLQKNGTGGATASNVNQLAQDLTVAFAPEIASGAKKDLREFRTTAKKLNLADIGALELKPISTTTVNLSVKLKNQKQADSIADVPFIVSYKKVFPPIGNDLTIDSNSNPVLIDPKTWTLTFNIPNLEPGAIYKVTEIIPYDQTIKDSHKIENFEHSEQLLKYLKDVEGLPVKNNGSGSSGKQDTIYFAPLNVPVSLESAWSHPLRYDYYEGEQVYVRFNEQAGTAITMDWLKQNLEVELIPHRTHQNLNVVNQQPVKKFLSSVTNYTQQQKGHFNNDVVLSDLKWDPQRVTATFKLQPKTLKSIVGAQIKVTMKDTNNYQIDPSKEDGTKGSGNSTQITQTGQGGQSKSQSITFRLQSSAAIVTPTNVDYMNPGLIGFSYAIYDPLDLIQKTGKDYNPFGEFPHLTPYDEQDWLKVVINKQPTSSISSKKIAVPDSQIFNNPSWDAGEPVQDIEVPEEPVAIRTKTDVGFGIKYVTLYWRINTDLGTFSLPEKFRNAKPLWYPAGRVVNLPISLQFKNPDITSPSSTYSFVLNSPYATPGHIMPYARTAAPHDALSIVGSGVNFHTLWKPNWGPQPNNIHLIPRINKFPKNISKVFWSAPSVELTTNDSVLNSIFYLNRAIPRLAQNNQNWLQIVTGDPFTKYTPGYSWKILSVDNKQGHVTKPNLGKHDFNWDFPNQTTISYSFSNEDHKSSWIISITGPNGEPLLYDPINYYAMLGPFKPPELPE
ncbi:DUF1410 domain-containing protein [Mesomycoplasma ovipneumoniae]|uniref:DUF1410 domain-containing protein n=1 Tax=Mesomycoplasma ovipneumoniae TaxID=29562 RepID=UPI0028ABF679|nr:DUF1410 domain-containing protein [Mesomycoplasma ovipneumoniae]WNM16184.1 DUF1410 domain-containing protein [Mesomycoplasma ovipneumoniae]